MPIFCRAILVIAAFLFTPAIAHAAESNCTLVVDYKTSEIIHEDGDCTQRHGAQSTFKMPLALMGFDSGILKNAHDPSWDYKPDYESNRKEEQAATDPTRWEKDSVVWFSQQITRKLGNAKFKNYVELLNYGNKNIAGDPGKNNGLTNSWLSSSLQISPIEQVSFVRGLLERKFKVSKNAYDMTLQIIPQFNSGAWNVYGKTGTGFHRKDDGTIDRNLQRGWFVGWAEQEGQKIVFAKFIADKTKVKEYAGPRARDIFLKELPSIITKHEHNQH